MRLLGGDPRADQVGEVVAYLQAPRDQVVESVLAWLPDRFELQPGQHPYPECLEVLTPTYTPHWRYLFIECADGWTAQLCNARGGGDPTAPAPHLSLDLGVRCLIAMSSPVRPPGHGGNQLWVIGPQGVPPLMYERTIAAVAEDGRWRWYADGTALPFEDLHRYDARRIRDRFDRPTLLTYLAELGVRADDDDFYESAVVIETPLERERWRTGSWI